MVYNRTKIILPQNLTNYYKQSRMPVCMQQNHTSFMLAGTRASCLCRAYLDELFEVVLILLGAAGTAVQAVVRRRQRRDAQSITWNRKLAFNLSNKGKLSKCFQSGEAKLDFFQQPQTCDMVRPLPSRERRPSQRYAFSVFFRYTYCERFITKLASASDFARA